jgi:hypothetical protein
MSMIDNVLNCFGTGSNCERVEIAVSWQFTKEQCNGPLCGWDGGTKTNRYLDLKKMLLDCVTYIRRDTKHLDISPIVVRRYLFTSNNSKMTSGNNSKPSQTCEGWVVPNLTVKSH